MIGLVIIAVALLEHAGVVRYAAEIAGALKRKGALGRMLLPFRPVHLVSTD
jgi:hypothetical protein